MRKRIDNNMTRRQMKQLKIFINPLVKEAYMQMCKEKGCSINLELERYIINQVNDWKKKSKQQKLNIKMTIKEATQIIKRNDDPELVEMAVNYLYDTKPLDLV
jgi:hypothetical protein